MSVAAVMLVKDEADVIGYTLEHLLGHVDEILVSDNGSTDETAAIVDATAKSSGRVLLMRDTEVAYYQDVKTTALAQMALEIGHQWVLPCDADEFWYAPDGRPIRDYLNGIAPDVQVVRGALFNHLPTAKDAPAWEVCPDCGGIGHFNLHVCPDCNGGAIVGEPNPFRRIQWRLREPAPLGKVCVRTDPDLQIHMGNHGAWLPGAMLTTPGLIVRHYTWRTEEQYVRKIINGAAAYAATDKPENVGGHWRMFGNPPDPDAVRAHFRKWFWSAEPEKNDSLIFDPAPFT